jgi:protein MpaA
MVEENDKMNPFALLRSWKNIILLALFTSITLVLCACASGHRAPFTVTPPIQRSLPAYELRLQTAVASSRHLSLAEIGRVSYPGFAAPLWRVLFQPDGTVKYKVLFSAGIHGNEPAGAECALRFVEALARKPERYEGIAFDIIPLVNPWGWTHDIRFNQAGIDINRDFATFDSQEANIIRDILEKDQYTIMFDLHEDPAAKGFYIYQYGLGDRHLTRQIVAAIEDLGYPVEQDVKMVILKTENGIIDAPMWGLKYMRLIGQLSITNYYRLYNSPYVFTVETPTSLPFEDRLIIQQTAVDRLVDNYTK